MDIQRITRVLTGLAAAALLASSPARAQERDPAAAQALFDEGQALVNAGRYAEACQKLAESLRLDPGIGTQFHLAACHEHEGKIASAWAEFLEVASLATASRQDARAKAASRRAALLEPRLPRLTIVVSPAARAPGLEVTRDGVVVGEAQWGLAVPVDPGARQIEVTAPGRKAFGGSVITAEGATSTFEVPALEAVPGTAMTTATPAAAAAVPTASETSAAPAPLHETAPAATSSGPSALVIGLGVGGLVFVGAGSVLGVMAMGKDDDSKEYCEPDDPNLCERKGVDLRDDALLFGDLATVGFAVGGAALITAAVLWIVDDGGEGAEQPAVSFGVTPGGVIVRGEL